MPKIFIEVKTASYVFIVSKVRQPNSESDSPTSNADLLSCRGNNSLISVENRQTTPFCSRFPCCI